MNYFCKSLYLSSYQENFLESSWKRIWS